MYIKRELLWQFPFCVYRHIVIPRGISRDNPALSFCVEIGKYGLKNRRKKAVKDRGIDNFAKNCDNVAEMANVH